MSDQQKETPDNVVRVNFGAPPAIAETRDPLAEEKLEIFSRLIEQGMVLVTLNTRAEGVSVPAQHIGNPQLHLNFSLRFFIDDFEYDEHGVRASLSFRGTPHFCDLPWHAVYMLRSQADETILVFPESFPEPLREMLASSSDLELVEEDARATRQAFLERDPEAEIEPEDEPKPPGSHLHLIK